MHISLYSLSSSFPLHPPTYKREKHFSVFFFIFLVFILKRTKLRISLIIEFRNRWPYKNNQVYQNDGKNAIFLWTLSLSNRNKILGFYASFLRTEEQEYDQNLLKKNNFPVIYLIS